MGQQHSSSVHSRLAASRFDQDEIVVLKKIWEDLAERNNGKGIDKETFLQYFPLNGLLGERLFAQFDVKKTGYINFDDFILGLSIASRGTIDEKIHFVFDMYNVSHDNKISKQELATLLNHIPKEVLHIHDNELSDRALGHRSSSVANMQGIPHVSSRQSMNLTDNNGNESGNESDSSHESERLPNGPNRDSLDERDDSYCYTNQDLVDKAFEECDVSHEGRLSYEEFKMWIEKNPALLEHIESILPYNGSKVLAPHHDKRETLPHARRTIRSPSLVRNSSYEMESRRMPSFRSRNNTISGSTHPHFPEVQLGSSLGRDSIGNMSRTASLGGQDRPTTPQGYVPSDSGLPPHPPASAMQKANSHPGGISLSQHSSSDNLTYQWAPASSNVPFVFGEEEANARYFLLQAFDASHSEVLKSQISRIIQSIQPPTDYDSPFDQNELEESEPRMEGYLWKRGKSILHFNTKRFYLLNGNCLFYYEKEKNIQPKGVIFLTGSLIERIKDEDMALKGFFGFELLQQDLSGAPVSGGQGKQESGAHGNRHTKRVLYCKSEAEREKWIFSLQHAAQVVPIEDDFVIGKELGRGRFSVVCECVHKDTGKRCAVKIIDKATIEPEEKQLLRTEIAVLKLVNHPNIIRLEGIYESKLCIYIVMEKLQGGELFQRIVGRPRFSETEAAKIIRPLLEAIAYLHDLGIVHRDIKPENILCGAELEDLKIADFGLSKMILPKEKMDKACGTLSYVAPEVLTMQGYGKEADLWSVGVIMFLLMCGKLPFDGDDHNEIVRNTIQGDLKVNATVWGKLGEESKSLMLTLLNKNAKERISARDALKHPFILKFAPHKKTHHSSVSPSNPSLLAVSGSPSADILASSKETRSSTGYNGGGDSSPTRAGSYAESTLSSYSESDMDG